MLDGNSFLQAGWIHGLKVHVFGSPDHVRFLVMGNVSTNVSYGTSILHVRALTCRSNIHRECLLPLSTLG